MPSAGGQPDETRVVAETQDDNPGPSSAEAKKPAPGDDIVCAEKGLGINFL